MYEPYAKAKEYVNIEKNKSLAEVLGAILFYGMGGRSLFGSSVAGVHGRLAVVADNLDEALLNQFPQSGAC